MEGHNDGSGVGLSSTYVGDADGDCVGIALGKEVGSGVGFPGI